MAFAVGCGVCSGGLLELSFVLPCLAASSDLLGSLKLAGVNTLKGILEILFRIFLPLFPDVWCARAGKRSVGWQREKGVLVLVSWEAGTQNARA